jgi:hypothetical protein
MDRHPAVVTADPLIRGFDPACCSWPAGNAGMISRSPALGVEKLWKNGMK